MAKAKAGNPKAKKGCEVRAAQRRVRALELRAAGLSYRQIAGQLDVSQTQAHIDVRRGLEAARAELLAVGKSLIALEYERLEAPVMQLVTQLKSGKLEPAALCQVADAIRKLSESRRKLLGLDAQSEFSGPGGAPVQIQIKTIEVAEASVVTGP